jgi:tetratricopeptide (TPR) repeat protein
MPHLTAALGSSQYDLGCLLQDAGRLAEAAEAFREAKMAFEDLNARNPDDPSRIHALAWLLADCPAVQFRDSDRAVQLAETCVQMVPTSSRYWRTLGVAHYRAGQWQAAVDAFQKTFELGFSRGNQVWLVLAMSYWQLGEKDQARKWRDRAIKWIDEHHETIDEAFRRYQSEASALITDED